MRYLLIFIAAGLVIWACIHFGIVRKFFHPQHLIMMDVTLAEADHILRNDQHRKTVAITASWCPACQELMPQYTHMDVPDDVEIYALSLDREDDEFQADARRLDGDVIWLRIKGCIDEFCTNNITSMQNMGFTGYRGQLPYFSILDEGGAITSQNLTIDAIPCVAKGTCTETCSGQNCTLQYR